MKQWIWKISWDSLPVLFACPEFTTNSYPHWATPDVPYGDTHILVRGRDFGKCCCKNHLPFWSFDTRFACHWGSIFSFITVGSYQPKKTSNIQNHCVNHHITHTDTHIYNHRFHRLFKLLITSCLYIFRIPPCPHQLKPTNDLMESN